MKIRFFGDSWYWAWYHNKDKMKSKQFKEYLTERFFRRGYQFRGVPALEMALHYFGYECENYCLSGSDFYKVTDDILTIPISDNAKYNVVLFSSLVRDPKVFITIYDFKNYDNFINKFNNDTIYLLKRIQNWAVKNNQYVIFVGGQSTLYKSIFNQAVNTKNMILLSECITSTLMGKPEPYKIFKLSSDFSHLVNETWNKQIVDAIYEDYNIFKNDVIGHPCHTPDTAHLNERGLILLADMIMNEIDRLEGDIK